MSSKTFVRSEIAHFTHLEHIWWGTKTIAGQKRYDNKIKEFLKKCQPKDNIKILEVGCGDGEFTKRLVKVLKPNSKLIATDITPVVIKRGKKLIKHKNLTLRLDNLESMSFPKDTFEIACGISILHHVKTEKALREIYRVLKKNGEIFFTEPNMLNPHIYFSHRIPFLRKLNEYSPDETAFKRWELERILKDVGFRNIEVKNYDFLYPLSPNFLIRTLEKIGAIAENIPLVKEISGSLIVYAKK